MKKNKVIIVGAGMAGLTAAAYLMKDGQDVLILDKNSQTGGLVNTFQRDGFSFDTGPRAFVNSGMVKPILADLGIEWETVDNIITLHVADQSVRVDSMVAIEDYQRMLVQLYPGHEDEIQSIVKMMIKLAQYTQTLYAFDNPYFVDYTKDKKFLVTQFLPWTFKLLHALRKFKQYNMPMEMFLEGCTGSQALRDILTQFFFKETPTYFALGYFYVWMDYFYPRGGTGTLPRLLHEKVAEWGGQFQMNTRIVEVHPAQCKVVDDTGHEYAYDHLIWAADLKTLYRQLNVTGLDPKTLERIHGQSQAIADAKPAESSFMMYLAVNRPPAYFQKRGGCHAFYTPSKAGLGEIHRSKQTELLERFDTLTKADILAWLDAFCERNTYEVAIPALRDASLAPDNQTGIMISCLFDYELITRIQQAGWLDEFTREMEARIIRVFSQSYFPDWEEDILFHFSASPLTIQNVVGSSGGAIVGWSFETASPVFNELKDMPKSAQTPIPNVYQAGQWAYAPAGVPIAMLTGWHASQEILKQMK